MNKNLEKKRAEAKELLKPTTYEYRKVKRENGKRIEVREERALQRNPESVRKLLGMSNPHFYGE